jgi:hypothetical protein
LADQIAPQARRDRDALAQLLLVLGKEAHVDSTRAVVDTMKGCSGVNILLEEITTQEDRNDPNSP